MSDLFSAFEAPAPDPSPLSETILPMSADQRAEIRFLFGKLGITMAREQFEVVYELTGTRIVSVNELTGANAHRLVQGLQRRVMNTGRATTGNAWADREEDTWIDRL